MPDPLVIATNTVAAHSGVGLYARVTNVAGTAITQASLTSAHYQVRDLTAQTSGTKTALTVSSVVYDALQTGEGWSDVDSTGYNFKYVVPATEFAHDPDDDEAPIVHRYQVDVLFTPASGEPFVVPFQFNAYPVWVS
jgi:hypothetical protein